jgi:hypothetical protein
LLQSVSMYLFLLIKIEGISQSSKNPSGRRLTEFGRSGSLSSKAL